MTTVHVASSAAAREVAQARERLKTARVVARRLDVIGRSIERELAKLPEEMDRAAVLVGLRDSLIERLGLPTNGTSGQ